jgi:nondiscriminating glutamyl-tRNA synthetase
MVEKGDNILTSSRSSNTVRVRFAPSPTGYLHVGNARTAIFNYLYTRKHGGKFILRLEDTDFVRSTRESVELILQDLRWLGIPWDEGPDMGGPHGPYRQSERLDIYRDYAQKLIKTGAAYYCYCTPEELETQRRDLLARKAPLRYTGKCRNLTAKEQKDLEAQGRRPTIRFRVGEDLIITFVDAIRGEVSFNTKVIGDFVLVRSDGVAAYNFAVVIDDALMEINHVIRGEDHLSNTPRQIILEQALGFPQPQFAHLPMILGPDHTRLSKRHGANSVGEFREAGILPEALVNYLALLGWSPGDDREILSLEEMIEEFSLSHVAKSAAVFDCAKLTWMNGNYIRKSKLEQVVEGCLPYLKQAGYVSDEPSVEEERRLFDIIATIQDRLETLSDVTEQAEIFFQPVHPNAEANQIAKEGKRVIACFEKILANAKEADRKSFKIILNQVKEETGIKGKNLFIPVRVALTGQTHGPDLAAIFEIIGKAESLNRLTKKNS